MWCKISILICSFMLCIHDSDEIDLLQSVFEQYHDDGYVKRNVTFDGIISCCCTSRVDFEVFITTRNFIHNHTMDDRQNCDKLQEKYETPCFCFVKFNDSTNTKEKEIRNFWNYTAIYVSVGVAASILFLTQIICLLLIRKKRTELLIERLSERRQSYKNQNAVIEKYYKENHEEKLHNKGLNHDPIRRNNFIVKERETSNIYHSLDNLHITPGRESSLQRIHRRAPHPLPNDNNREDDNFHFKMSSVASALRLAPQMQPQLQKTGNAFVASELNHLLNNRRLLNDNNNTDQMDKKFGADVLRQKSNTSTGLPKVLPALKPKPALPFNRHLEEMWRTPHSRPLLKFKTDTSPASTLKPRASSPPQITPLRFSSEHEDDDDWNYEQLPPINMYKS